MFDALLVVNACRGRKLVVQSTKKASVPTWPREGDSIDVRRVVRVNWMTRDNRFVIAFADDKLADADGAPDGYLRVMRANGWDARLEEG